jgi:hypothetical protein
MHKPDTLEKIELPRESTKERLLKSAIGDLQNALFRTRHGNLCGEQITAAYNKISDFMAAEALTKVRSHVTSQNEHILWDNLETKHLQG